MLECADLQNVISFLRDTFIHSKWQRFKISLTTFYFSVKQTAALQTFCKSISAVYLIKPAMWVKN